MASLDSLLNNWLIDLEEADRSAKTIMRYKGIVEAFLSWAERIEKRSISLNDLTPILFMGYRSGLQKERSTATVNVHVAALRAWSKWLLENNYLSENPTRNLKQIGQIPSAAPESLSNTAVNALLREAQRGRYGQRDYAIIQMLLQTGMRIGECQNLSYADVILRERSGSVLIRSGKGNKARTVPLNRSARLALIEYGSFIFKCPPQFQIVEGHWSQQQASNLPLWPSQKTKQLSTAAIWRLIHRTVEACAQRELVPSQTKPHDLRHTFAHRYLQQNPGDLVGLSRLLGHESLDTTKIYTQPTADELAQRVEQISLNAYH